MIKAKVIGGKELRDKLRKMGAVSDEIFKDVVVDSAQYANRKAMENIEKNVKTGTGHLKGYMYVEHYNNDMSAEVGNRADYAGYVEFGTGKKVNVPAEFSSIASSIRAKKRDNWEVAMRRIRDWLKMMGYDVKNAYPMYINIVKNGRGVRPRPFMYPAYLSTIRYMRKEADKALKKLIKTK